jgi:hypothetical protein
MLSNTARQRVLIALLIVVIAVEAIGVATGHLALNSVVGAILGLVIVGLIFRFARGKTSG